MRNAFSLTSADSRTTPSKSRKTTRSTPGLSLLRACFGRLTFLFFYLLKAWNIRVASASTPGEFVFVFNPEWLEDANAAAQAYNIEASMPVRAHGSNFRIGSAGAAEVLRLGDLTPLGKVRPLVGATQNLVLFNYETNVDTSTYDSVGMFWVYRKEALTVPGFLESLRNPLVVR